MHSPSRTGALVSYFFVRDTGAHVAHEQLDHGQDGKALAAAGAHRGNLRAARSSGVLSGRAREQPQRRARLGLAPLYLAANGASAREIGIVAGVYPALWGAGQLATGWLSDHTGRKPLIVLGMLVQAAGLALLALRRRLRACCRGGGSPGVGTALVYPTLIAAVSDAVQPRDRAPAVGVYRFWRDAGFALGGLLAGVVADAAGASTAIAVVAVLTAASGLFVAATPWHAAAARLLPRRGARQAGSRGARSVIRVTSRS